MPLKLNVAISRKVGEPNYGSRGATVGLEMEVDSSLADQPRQPHERIARLFRLAQQPVDRELGAGNSEPTTRPASPAQILALHAIANRWQLDLAAEIDSHVGLPGPEDLSLDQASRLIDAIKPSANAAKAEP